MKRMKVEKIIYALFCVLVLSFCMPEYITAAKPFELSVESGYVEEGNINVYVSSTLSGKTTLDAKNYQITLGNTKVTCDAVTQFSKTGKGVAYVFLMDVSGSISGEKLKQMKTFLLNITAKLGKNDKVCVATIGNNLSAGKFTGDKEKIKSQIKKIKGLSEDTNLYQGIVDSMKLLDTENHGAARKALVILSDGQDDQTKGITRKEVDTALKEKHIPVYTAAMLDRDATEKQESFAKILGSFARQSAGGFHTLLKGSNNSTIKKYAEKIVSDMEKGVVLKGNIADYKAGNGQVYLQVTMDVKGTGKASDGFLVSESTLGLGENVETPPAPSASAEPEKKATEAPKATETASSEETEEGSSFPIWIPIVAGCVLLVAVLLLIVLLNRGKKQSAMEEAPIALPPEEPAEKEAPVAVHETKVEKEIEVPEASPVSPVKMQPERVVYLAKVGLKENQTYEIHIRGEVTLGRDGARANYAFPEDMLISGLHCSISAFDNDLVLCDQNSKNGTWVNGIPIKEPYVLSRDDVIQIGKTELRIYW